MITLFGSVGTVVMIIFFNNSATYKEFSLQNLSSISSLISENSTSGLVFEYEEIDDLVLQSLKAVKFITHAAIFTKSGKTFACFQRQGELPFEFQVDNIESESVSFEDGIYLVQSGIYLDEEFMGSLFIKAESHFLEQFVFHNSIPLLLGIGVIIALSLILAYFLRGYISTPIQELVGTIHSIESTGEYQKRVEVNGKNEFGQLSKAFNSMIEQVDIHDTELKLLNKSLEERVEERTSEINREKQISDQKSEELRVSNEALEGFVYRVSHDLKGPVVNQLSMLKMLRKRVPQDDPKIEPVVKRLEDSALQFQRVIEDFLELAKLEQTEAQEITEIDLQVLTADILWNFETEIQSEKAEIKIDFSACPKLNSSEVSLRSILSNLISNAIKYRAPDRSPIVEISSEKVGEEICIKVKDNGLGIDLEKNEEKLFMMFKRLHNHVEGTGIGLFTVKKMIEKLSGHIEVESELDEGTSFKVFLPLGK